MAGDGLSEAALRTALRDIHLPAEAAGGPLGEFAATIALAGVAALAVAGLVRLIGRRRRPARAPGLDDLLAGFRTLPGEARRIALLHLLKSRAPARFAALRGGLYHPGGGPGCDQLEAELRADG